MTMYREQTPEDSRDFDLFLLEDVPNSWSNNSKQQPEENEKITLKDLLQTLYFINADKDSNISYFQRDLTKTPLIDKTKKEVTFETKAGIKKIFAYEIDDTKETE